MSPVTKGPTKTHRKPVDGDVAGGVDGGSQMSMSKGSWLMYLVQGMGELQRKCWVKVGREGKGWVGSSICEGRRG